jgi:hypothetical protein
MLSWLAVRWSALAMGSILLFGASVNRARAEEIAPPVHPASAAEAYELGYVGFREMISLDSNGHRTWSAYRGKYRETLDGADFYLAVDRPDLASGYRRRHATRVILLTGGIGVAVAGALLAGDGARSAGGVMLVGGIAGAVASLFVEPDPVGETEARMLADLHNKALRRELSVPPVEERNVLSQMSAPSAWSLSPLVGRSAGGVMLVASF